MEGFVKSIIPEKGYGFIQSGDESLFFHCTFLPDDLPFDERLLERRVSFDRRVTSKGSQAIRIREAL